jgi:hypothetical protein
MLKDIETGLKALRQVIQQLGLRSVAVPPLGCGNGGLDWTEVYPLIRRYMDDLPNVRVIVYPPAGAPAAKEMPNRTPRPRITESRATFLMALDRYCTRSVEFGFSDVPKLSLIETQKVAYFLQIAGGPVQWDFVPSYYGPYAQTVNQFVSSVEGHFITGYGDGTGGSKATLTLDSQAISEAQKLLDGDTQFGETLGKFEEIVEGFEFPYGIELLATVHYVVASCSSTPTVDEVVTSIKSWSRRKGSLFQEKQVTYAYRHLAAVGIVEPAPDLDRSLALLS